MCKSNNHDSDLSVPSDTASTIFLSECLAKCFWWNRTSGYVSLASGVAGFETVKISYLRQAAGISPQVTEIIHE